MAPAQVATIDLPTLPRSGVPPELPASIDPARAEGLRERAAPRA